MMQRQTSTLLSTLLGAVLAAGPLAMAHAGQQEAARAPRFITQTDRLIVKYKDAGAATAVDARAVDGKGAAAAVAAAPAIPLARQAILDRAGQLFGATLR